VEYTENLDSPEVFRRWAAITAIAAALEQKVWMETSSPLYPNLYTMLVGHPGVGKTRVINAARAFLAELMEFHIAPTSVTSASLVDALHDAKRFVPMLPGDPMEFNSMTLIVDDWQVFMSKYENQLIAGLTTFYDVTAPYTEKRRTMDLNILIKAPQLSILSGNTPSQIAGSFPPGAWDQGFCSRLLMIFSDERPIGDDFSPRVARPIEDLLHDLQVIYSLTGKFEVSAGYITAVRTWRGAGQPPVPTHPKLLHYNSRRRAQLYKLSMVSSADRGSHLAIEEEDFDRALKWLLDAEGLMPEVFRNGGIGADGKTMEELQHLVLAFGKPVPERTLVRWATERMPTHAVLRVIEIMERSGMIKATEYDAKTALRRFVATHEDDH
jgi:hypothetical protein